jgi:hypothetical protein
MGGDVVSICSNQTFAVFLMLFFLQCGSSAWSLALTVEGVGEEIVQILTDAIEKTQNKDLAAEKSPPADENAVPCLHCDGIHEAENSETNR